METFSALLAICAGNSPVTGEFPNKCHWHGALMFPLICAWINDWVNNREAGDLRRHHTHYDVTVMKVDTNTCMMVFFRLFLRAPWTYTPERLYWTPSWRMLSLPLVAMDDTYSCFIASFPLREAQQWQGISGRWTVQPTCDDTQISIILKYISFIMATKSSLQSIR